ncbi:hypothetical protein [Shewanella maritima]|uniref:hypothetical protein n=1 Tax=Shewanella maritima TaxID=2520507 RepID=UPI003736EAC5
MSNSRLCIKLRLLGSDVNFAILVLRTLLDPKNVFFNDDLLLMLYVDYFHDGFVSLDAQEGKLST